MALLGLLEWVHQNTAVLCSFSWKSSWRPEIQRILQNFPPTDSVPGVQSTLSCSPSPTGGSWLSDFSIPLYLAVKSSLALCDSMDCSPPGFSVLHYLPEFAQTHVHWVSDAIHLIHCYPLLLLLSIFPSIRVFSNELALLIRWPNYQSFSFSVNPSNEYSRVDFL